MDLPLTIQQVEKFTVVEFRTASLMDPTILDHLAAALYRLVDVEDQRRIILDFENVQYLSSQAIGIVMGLRKRLDKLPHTTFVLCGVGPTLAQLIRIMGLEKVLTIRPTQREAVKVLQQ